MQQRPLSRYYIGAAHPVHNVGEFLMNLYGRLELMVLL